MARARFNRAGLDPWPAYVDVLSTLLLAIVFLLVVFVLSEFFLTQALSGRDSALRDLTAQIERLSETLTMERQAKSTLESDLTQLRATLADVTHARDTAQKQIEALTGALSGAETKQRETEGRLTEESKLSAEARAEVQALNQQIAALRQQLARIEAALAASDAKEKEQKATIADLGRRLNLALARKVEELSQYRSEFFGELRKVLGERSDISIVGDRFVLQSEVLFDLGSPDLGEQARAQLDKIAQTLLQIAPRIPETVPWILRVDGHTDALPIRTQQFPSNWDLSTARALAVAKYLIAKGVPPNRIAAAGFGEYQPIDPRQDEIGYRRNRRIELKLTDR